MYLLTNKTLLTFKFNKNLKITVPIILYLSKN